MFNTVFSPRHGIHCSVRCDIMHLNTGANVPQIRALVAYSYVLAFAMLIIEAETARERVKY
jgi:hypothetical protein